MRDSEATHGPPFEAPEPEPPPPEPYAYTAPVGEDHFLARWVGFASERTDAAHEYHEAAALNLLASATPNVRAKLGPYPDGLATNLYAIFVGDSTRSRKSTAKDFARDVQARALPGSLAPDDFSPEGFVEHLAGRPNDSTTLYVDEFGETLEKLHHARYMAGLRGLLLKVYAGQDHTYRRHSKRKKGGEREADEDAIRAPHLSILGCTAKAIFDVLLEKDVTSGLLGRFAIVMPEAKPARKPFYEASAPSEAERSALVAWLHRLHAWAHEQRPNVVFEPGVLEILDGFAARLEEKAPDRSEPERRITDRIAPMAIKVAMLLAAGRPETLGQTMLAVTEADAQAALEIAGRWERDALRFVAQIGETDFWKRVDRVRRLLDKKRVAPRSVVARQAHVDKKTLDNIRDTLVDRAEIRVGEQSSKSGPSGELWEKL